MAEHELGAAAYAIRAARAAAPEDCQAEAGRAERDWQRTLLPEPIRQLVLEDQARRNEACWDAFADQARASAHMSFVQDCHYHSI